MDGEEDVKIEALAASLRENSCQIDGLKTALVPGAGRGIYTTKTFRPCSYILRLAENSLITSDTVLQSAVGPAIVQNPGILTSPDALCLFLMSEQSRISVSPWRPYLETLPPLQSADGDSSSSVLAFAFLATSSDYLLEEGEEEERKRERVGALLPPKCRRLYFEHLREIDSSRRRVLKVWDDAKPLLFLENNKTGAELLEDDETLFRWAWSCVNSRCIYKQSRKPSPLFSNPDEDGDSLALAPYLDMINHSPTSKLECSFCSHTRTFGIFTHGVVSEGQQVFICYGQHSNAVLLLEYGFVLDHNPNNAVYLEQCDLERLCAKLNCPVTERHWDVFNESKLLSALYGTESEPPWTFMATMQLLTMKEDHLHGWRGIYYLPTFDDPSVIQFAKALLSEYLAELQDQRPDEDSLKILPSRFRPMVVQIWQDDISIVSDSLSYLSNRDADQQADKTSVIHGQWLHLLQHTFTAKSAEKVTK